MTNRTVLSVELNGLRFFLALVVVVGHCSFVNRDGDWSSVGLWLNQGSAVFAFFVVDGFACADRLGSNRATYLNWRFYRIYPIFLANLFLVLAVYHAIGGGFRYPLGQDMPLPTGGEIVGTLVMLQQFATLVIPLNGQTWSVACYCWLSVFGRRFQSYPTLPLLWIIGASYLVFLVFQHLMPAGMQTWTYGRALLGGAWIWLTGFMWHRLKGTNLGVALTIAPAAVAAASGYFIGLPFLVALVILMVSDFIVLGPALTKAMVWLGDASFPIYLCHTSVIAYLEVVSIRGEIRGGATSVR